MKFLKNSFEIIFLFGIINQCLANYEVKNETSNISTKFSIESLGKIYEGHSRFSPQLSRITFYRPHVADRRGAYSIKINGDYHASLQPGGYTNLCIQPMQVQLQAHHVENGKPRTTQNAQVVLDLHSGKDTYVRIEAHDNAEASISIVESQLAQTELENTRQQIHTLSRVPQATPCEDPAQENQPEPQHDAASATATAIAIGSIASKAADPTPGPTPLADLKVKETIQLDTDNYFNFSKSEIADMLPESRQKLSNAVARIQQQLAQSASTRIHIIGYSDALGRPQRKKTIAAQRAQTIRNYLVRQGIPAQKITSEGRSDTDLVVADCAPQISATSIACNKNNRRVFINISDH